MYINTYWNLNRDYIPINETVTSVNLTVTFQTLSMFKWQMYSAQVNISQIKKNWGPAFVSASL